MSTPQSTANISIELSFPDERPLATINFSKANISRTLYWTRNGGDAGFLEGIDWYITSTVEQIYPPLDKNSEDSARPTQMKTIAVSNHNEYPVTPEFLRMVVDLTDRITQEWAELQVCGSNQNAS